MVTLTAPETSTTETAGTEESPDSFSVDLAGSPVRDLNQALHNAVDGQSWTVTSPGGKHSLAVGINADVTVTVEGHAGYYAAGAGDGPGLAVDCIVEGLVEVPDRAAGQVNAEGISALFRAGGCFGAGFGGCQSDHV